MNFIKKKKNNTHKPCETPSKNKTKKFKESDLKYEPYPKASFPTLSVNFSKCKISDQICKDKMTQLNAQLDTTTLMLCMCVFLTVFQYLY